MSVNRTHAFVLTDRLMALRDRGLVRQERRGTPRSRTTSFHVTDAGAACLAGLRQRFGPEFGRVELVRETEHRRADQSSRRLQRWTSHLNFAAMRRAHATRRA